MNVSPSGTGIILINGSPAPAYPYTYTFGDSTTVTIEAEGAQGYTFEYWAGCISGSANPDTIVVNQTRSVTAYFTPASTTAALGGFVWDDADGNGIWDSGEGSIDGHEVYLLHPDGTFIGSTTTVDGSFVFAGLEPGDYRLHFMSSPGYVFSPRDQGEDDARDSDILPSGLTDVIAVEAGEENLSSGAGLFYYATEHFDLMAWEARQIIETFSELIIIDVREKAEFCGEGGHIPGAMNMPWYSGNLEENVSILPLDTPILLVCGSGYRSANAAEHLSYLGFTSIYNMVGGMKEWQWETLGCDDSCSATLYFPGVRSGSAWETEVCVINPSAEESLSGVLTAYNQLGETVSEAVIVSLSPSGREAVVVGEVFNSPGDIDYIVFESCEEPAGYIMFFKEGMCRAAVPALTKAGEGERHLSHIASNHNWQTEITLLNTAAAPQEATLLFNNGVSTVVSLPAKGQATFTISSLFGGQKQPGISSGIVSDADGLIGLQLFEKGSQLFGIVLEDSLSRTVYYPHTVSTDRWATGIIAYNPTPSSVTAIITAYNQQGATLLSNTVVLEGRMRYGGTMPAWGVPPSAAWCAVESETALAGFEALFAADNERAASLSGVGISKRAGILPRLETKGWTGIVIVNTGDAPATVDLVAYNDLGEVLGAVQIGLNAFAKVQGVAEKLFSLDLSGATYARYSSDREVVVMLSGGSSDGTMFDALPSL